MNVWLMDIEFKNFDTGKKIKLSSDKSLIIVYGNRNGKTTLSNKNYLIKDLYSMKILFSLMYIT